MNKMYCVRRQLLITGNIQTGDQPHHLPTKLCLFLIVKYNIGLKTLLQQGISEPIFYGDLVYKFKGIVGKPNSSD